MIAFGDPLGVLELDLAEQIDVFAGDIRECAGGNIAALAADQLEAQLRCRDARRRSAAPA